MLGVSGRRERRGDFSAGRVRLHPHPEALEFYGLARSVQLGADRGVLALGDLLEDDKCMAIGLRR